MAASCIAKFLSRCYWISLMDFILQRVAGQINIVYIYKINIKCDTSIFHLLSVLWIFVNEQTSKRAAAQLVLFVSFFTFSFGFHSLTIIDSVNIIMIFVWILIMFRIRLSLSPCVCFFFVQHTVAGIVWLLMFTLFDSDGGLCNWFFVCEIEHMRMKNSNHYRCCRW